MKSTVDSKTIRTSSLSRFALIFSVLIPFFFIVTPAHSCSFNCDKTPELRASGFATKTADATPYANGYRGETPAPAMANPANAKLVIWLHGQGNPRKKETCAAQHNLPPRSLLELEKAEDIYLYYHCSAVLDPRDKKENSPDDGMHYTYGYAMGYYTLGRVAELRTVLEGFQAIGVEPSNITLAGHSAGGWTALLAAASYPEKMQSVIAFAPAFAGRRSEESSYPWWRKIVRPEQIAIMTQPNNVAKLIFAYEDDAFNRPSDLAFITKTFPQSATLISQNCGKGHKTHKNDCQLDKTMALMKELILRPQ